MTSFPSFSVIIPVYRGDDYLERCLRAAREQTRKPLEIIVVLEWDARRNEAHSLAAVGGAIIVQNVERQGDALNRNAGARLARGDILLFLDQDVLLHADVIEKYLEAFVLTPDLAAVFGSYDDAPPEPNFLSQYKNLLNHFVHQAGQREASTFCAAFGAVRRDAFEKMEGFLVTEMGTSLADIELGYRLKEAGLRIHLRKEIQATHLKRWSLMPLLHGDILVRAAPWTEMILGGQNRLVNDLNIRVSARACVILSWSGVVCLAASVGSPWFLPMAFVFLGSVAAVEAPLGRFFFERRGGWFALRAMIWQVFYHFYCGVGFLLGAMKWLTGQRTLHRSTRVAPSSCERPTPR